MTSSAFRIGYVTGTVQGTIVRDDMEVGGLTLTNQSFGAASTVSSDLITVSCDGIFVSILQGRGNLLSMDFLLQISSKDIKKCDVALHFSSPDSLS